MPHLPLRPSLFLRHHPQTYVCRVPRFDGFLQLRNIPPSFLLNLSIKFSRNYYVRRGIQYKHNYSTSLVKTSQRTWRRIRKMINSRLSKCVVPSARIASIFDWKQSSRYVLRRVLFNHDGFSTLFVELRDYNMLLTMNYSLVYFH